MSKILIIKLGATGDVVRTTPLLRAFREDIDWITASKNLPLIQGVRQGLTSYSWEDREQLQKVSYDFVINLEDDLETANFAKSLKTERWFGAYVDDQGKMTYTQDSKAWFDLSLISRFGRTKADELKLQNRFSYQELIFSGLGLSFKNDRYLMPKSMPTGLKGDIAIATEAGPVWPMKNWAYFGGLQEELEQRGYKVNILKKRDSLLEHLADIEGHKCLVSGDSLPMHLALGLGIPCVSLFTCTSPWEIYDYGIQKKIISPLLEQYFYKRTYDEKATQAIKLEEVLEKVLSIL